MIIHVGFPKTATTFLQKNVFPYLELNYIGKNYVPLAGIIDERWKILKELKDLSKDISSTYKKLEKFIDRDNINLISEEEFSTGHFLIGNENDGLLISKRLHKLFPNAKIIVGVRELKDLVISLYREYILEGGVHDFKHFLYNILVIEKYNYKRYMETLQNLFGSENIFIFKFEDFKRDNKKVIKEMCDFIGVRCPNFKSKIIRKGYGKKQIEIAKFLNKLFKNRLNPNGLIPLNYGTFFPPKLLLNNRFSYRLNYERKVLSMEELDILNKFLEEKNLGE